MDKKTFQKEYQKDYYLKNKSKIDARNDLWQQSHRAERVKHVQAYVLRNVQKVADYNAHYSRDARGRFRTLRHQATRRGLVNDFTFEEFCIMTSRACHYCGTQPPYVGIDRVDNNKGYLLANSVPCCKFCNMMKKDMSVNDFLAHIQLIAKHQIGL